VQKLPLLSAVLVATLSVVASSVPNRLPDFTRLAELDLQVPFCEGTLRLENGSSFVEIENPLAGASKYNDLVRLYLRRNYGELQRGMESFRKEFETSPLNEAIDFLELQSEIEQLESGDAEELKSVEAKFRNLMVLFPRSSLAPALHTGLAGAFLKLGSFSKALGLYQVAYQEYPFHETACTNILGTAEANYQLGNLDEAEKGYQMVVQKCQTLKLLIGARVRLVDISRQRGGKAKDFEKSYEKLNEEYPSFITRYHPELLFNLGEIKFRGGNLSSSEFFFNQFQKNTVATHSCHPAFMKRVADLSEKTKKSHSIVIGNYLAVYEKFPKNNLGRFSRAHALLLDFPELSSAEKERRISIIEDELAKIDDLSIKNAVSVQLGIALLESDPMKSIELLDQQRKKDPSFFSEPFKDYVRKTILRKAQLPLKDETKEDQGETQQRLKVLESAYLTWFKGSREDEKVRRVFANLVNSEFSYHLKRNKLKKAISKLEDWSSSALFNSKEIEPKTRITLSSQFSYWWLLQSNPVKESTAQFFLEKTELLSEILKPEGEPLWLQAYLESGNLTELENLVGKLKKERELASFSKYSSEKEISPLAFILGKALRVTKNYPLSAQMLSQVKDPTLFELKTPEQMKTDISMRKSTEAIKLGLSALNPQKESFNRSILEICRDGVIDGKNWKWASRVTEAAEKMKLTDQELVPFLTMAGRAYLEMKDCQKSKETYLRALKIEPEMPNRAESKFNLGRCLYQLKDIESAKKEWSEVATFKDELWSPLAENELKILESK